MPKDYARMASMKKTRQNVLCLLAVALAATATAAFADGKATAKSLPLPLSTVTRGTLATPAETDRFTFQGTQGQRLYFDSLDKDAEHVVTRLIGPDGATVFSLDYGADYGPFYLAQTGAYTIELQCPEISSASYSFRLLDTTQAAALSFAGPTSGSLIPAAQSVLYKFAGVAGQRINLAQLNDPAAQPEGFWRVVSPAGLDLANQVLAADIGDVFLPENGTYLLAIDGSSTSPAAANYRFRASVVSTPSGAPAGFGAAHVGKVASGESLTFNYSAPAGTVIALDGRSAENPAQLQIRDAADQILWQSDSQADSPAIMLASSGALRVVVQNPGSPDPQNFNFALLNLSNDATPLAFGQPISRALDTLSMAVYTFNGAPGQKLAYDALQSTPNSAYCYLQGPSGILSGGLADQDTNPIRLTQPGRYYLMFYSSAAGQSLKFRLLESTTAPSAQLALNSTVTRSLGAYETDYLQFTVTKPERIVLDGLTPGVALGISIFDPEGGLIYSIDPGGVTELKNAAPGNYSIVAANSGEASVSYSLKVLEASSSSETLKLGVIASGTIAASGQERHYTFNGTGGQRLFYDDLSEVSLPLRLVAPSGTHLYDSSTLADGIPITLTESGQYDLVVGGPSDVTGNYSFRLIDAAQNPASALALDTAFSGNLDPFKSKVFRLDLVAGSQYFFDSLDPTSGGVWSLFGPANNLIVYSPLSADFVYTATESGTFLLVASSVGAAPGTFSVRVATATAAAQTLTLNAVTTGTITDAGKPRRYTFSGTAGQRLFYDGLQNDFDNIVVQLLDPSGKPEKMGQNSDSDYGLFSLAKSGTYTLVVGGQSDVTGGFKFRLLDLAAMPELGPSTSGQLNPALKADIYKIVVGTPRKITFAGSAENEPTTFLTLFGPNNEVLRAGALNASSATIAFESPGTYCVEISDNGSPLPTVGYTFTAVSGALPQTVSGFGTREAGTVQAGEQVQRFYTGPAGLMVYFDGQNFASQVMVQLVDQSNGAVVFSGNSGTDAYPFVLPSTGGYTLTIDNLGGTAAGDYAFRMIDMTHAPAFQPGAVVAGVADHPYQTDILRFEVQPGTPYYYDGLSDGQNSSMVFFLGSPVGTFYYGCSFSCYTPHGDLGWLYTTEVGTHYAVLASQQEAPAAYRFRILDPNQAPSIAIGLDTTVGGALVPVPPSQLNITGSYIGENLTLRPDVDDWRQSQTVAGTRKDPDIDFGNPGWGTLASVGLAEVANGTSADWDTFSAQWDGTITITRPNTRVYFKSDESARFWVDQNKSGQFEESELVDNGWGIAHGPTLSGASAALATGTYKLRAQYAEGSGDNQAFLLEDSGSSLGPLESLLFRFTAPAGQRLVFNTLTPEFSGVAWNLTAPDGSVSSGGLGGNTEIPASSTAGTWNLVLQNNNATPASYGFKFTTPTDTRKTLVMGQVYSGTLAERDERHEFTFEGVAGQRLYYDSIQTQYFPVNARLVDSAGNVVGYFGNSNTDAGPFTLPRTGTYTLVQDSDSDLAATYSFRLLDVASFPLLKEDETITGALNPVGTAQLYLLREPLNMKIALVATGAPDGFWALYGPNDALVNQNTMNAVLNATIGNEGTHVLVVATAGINPVNYSLKLIPGNHAPSIAPITDKTIREDQPFSLAVAATDPEQPNDRLTFSLVGSVPEGLSIDPATGLLTWTPNEAQGPASYPVTVGVVDDAVPSRGSSLTFTLHVEEANRGPVLNPIGNKVVNEGAPLAFTAFATDADLPKNSLVFSLGAGAPDGASIDPVTGAFAWTPTEAQGPGVFPIKVIVTDSSADPSAPHLSATEQIQVTVSELNTKPVIAAIGDKTLNEGTLLSFPVAVTDTDLPANTLRFSLGGTIPVGASIDPATGVFSWTPEEKHGPGSYTITVIVQDTSADTANPSLSDTATFKVTVNEVNTPPALGTLGKQTVDEGSTLVFVATATDTDIPANTLSFSLGAGFPQGASIDSSTGRFTWTPTEAQGPGKFSVVVVVTDSGTPPLSSSQTVEITVNEVNAAPTLAAVPNRFVAAGRTLTLQAAGVDTDLPAQTLTYTLEGTVPAGAAVNASSGLFTWAAPAVQATFAQPFTLKVADNGTPSLSATRDFTVTVVPVPVIQSIRIDNGKATVVVATTSGARYALESTADLGHPNWVRVGTEVAAGGSTTAFADPDPASAQRFYRVALLE